MRDDRDALNTALELLRRGLWPVGIHSRGATIKNKYGNKLAAGKEPLGGKGWGLRRWDENKLCKEFARQPQAGVGICLSPGRAPDRPDRGSLIDLEGDVLEATGPDGDQ